MKLSNGDLAAKDAGQLREHLIEYLEELAEADRGDDAFEDEYVQGVARRIASLAWSEGDKWPWVVAESLIDLDYDEDGAIR